MANSSPNVWQRLGPVCRFETPAPRLALRPFALGVPLCPSLGPLAVVGYRRLESFEAGSSTRSSARRYRRAGPNESADAMSGICFPPVSTNVSARRSQLFQVAKNRLPELRAVHADTESTPRVAASTRGGLGERHLAENSTECRLLSDPLREREPSESAPVGGTAAQDARSKRGQPSYRRRASARLGVSRIESAGGEVKRVSRTPHGSFWRLRAYAMSPTTSHGSRTPPVRSERIARRAARDDNSTAVRLRLSGYLSLHARVRSSVSEPGRALLSTSWVAGEMPRRRRSKNPDVDSGNPRSLDGPCADRLVAGGCGALTVRRAYVVIRSVRRSRASDGRRGRVTLTGARRCFRCS